MEMKFRLLSVLSVIAQKASNHADFRADSSRNYCQATVSSVSGGGGAFEGALIMKAAMTQENKLGRRNSDDAQTMFTNCELRFAAEAGGPQLFLR